MNQVSSWEALHRDYSPRGVKFYFIYKTLAHPERDGYVEPITLEERLMHVREAQRTLRTGIPWICDTMTNDLKHALGGAPTSEFVIDPEGKVVRRRMWSDAEALREDLIELVGAVENPTHPDDIDMEPPEEKRPASGVVKRVRAASSTRPLKTEPIYSASGMPYYVKLRAEADDALMEGGTGQMYLGFHLDPIYRVHWNNLSEPMEFELDLPEGVTATPSTGTGPKLEVAADVDPREFLIDVRDFKGGSIGVKVRYVACDDAETFCVPAEHEFKIYPEFDAEAGKVFARLRRFDRDDDDDDDGAEEEHEADEGDKTVSAGSDPGILEMTGHFEGRLSGRVDAILTGMFKGRIFGVAGVEIEGEFDGRLSGRVRGRIDGQFTGQLDGRIGGRMGEGRGRRFRGRPGGRTRGGPGGRFGGRPGGRPR